MHGLTEKHISIIHAIFKKYDEIEEAFLYGSRAKGTYQNGSDIDLTLKGERLNSSILSRICNELEESYLPHEVDISIYHTIDNPRLIEQINKAGTLFYKKTPSFSPDVAP